MKQWNGIFRQLAMLSQFGLSLITPLLVCLAASWLLSARMGLGGWVYIPGFFFGMGGSAMVAYKHYLLTMKEEKKKKKKERISFNRHL